MKMHFFSTVFLGVLLLFIFAGCAFTSTSPLRATQRALIEQGEGPMRIVTWDPIANRGDAVLRRKAVSAAKVDHSLLLKLDTRMRATLAASGGVGLAAPQVGVSLRMILIQLQDPSRKVITCIDPVIKIASKKMVDSYEGCLSIPGKGGKVRRHDSLQVVCIDLEGRRQVYKTSGFEAVIFQHEIDHLHGILYTDKLKGELMTLEEMRRKRSISSQPAKTEN